jgi:peptidoglycan/xylan/chitin deacetylase (PgdA/CDA1 family)
VPATSAQKGPHISGARARRARVPILMYHVISAPPAGTPYPALWVAPGLFAAQMHALARAGYRAVTLERVMRAWTDGAPLPAHPIVLSFDDGYRSDDTHAGPVLRRLGWPGVLNLELDNAAPDGISDTRIRHLIAGGWEIGSHTLTHPDLTTLPDAALRHELEVSRAEIRRRFGRTPTTFCYPAGRYDARVVQAVRAAGYTSATTEQPGWASPSGDRLTLPRIRVSGGESPATLLAAITSSR